MGPSAGIYDSLNRYIAVRVRRESLKFVYCMKQVGSFQKYIKMYYMFFPYFPSLCMLSLAVICILLQRFFLVYIPWRPMCTWTARHSLCNPKYRGNIYITANDNLHNNFLAVLFATERHPALLGIRQSHRTREESVVTEWSRNTHQAILRPARNLRYL
jgi:hypothetical protein